MDDESAKKLINASYKDGEIAAAEAVGVELLNAAGIEPEPIRWIWPGWLARNKIHLIAGAPGTGKTTIALSIAASVSKGSAFPDGHKTAPGKVILWSDEDELNDTLVPRLIAAGADLNLIEFVGPVTEFDPDRKANRARPFDPAYDIDELTRVLAPIDNVALIIIDPITSAISGDSHKNNDVRRGLAPLGELARQKDAALLGITHFTKGTQGRDPLERVTGSLGFGARGRFVFATAKQRQAEGEETEPQFVLMRVKTNHAKPEGGFRYEIKPDDIEINSTKTRISTTRIKWGAAIDGDPRAVFAEAEADPDDGEPDAVDFLRGFLSGGQKEFKEVVREGRAAGYSLDQLKRAKKSLRVKSEKDGMGGGWYWRLHDSEEPREGPDVPW